MPQNEIKHYSRGATLQQINVEDLKKLSIALPPLDEQKRIFNELEQLLPLKPADIRRFTSASIEVMGKGQVTIGMLHSRWSRAGKGEFLPGGRRLIDPATGADIAYYFNPQKGAFSDEEIISVYQLWKI